MVNISLCEYSCDLVVSDETEDGISPLYFTNVFVSSTDFLTVSADVSNTWLKSIVPNSVQLKIT